MESKGLKAQASGAAWKASDMTGAYSSNRFIDPIPKMVSIVLNTAGEEAWTDEVRLRRLTQYREAMGEALTHENAVVCVDNHGANSRRRLDERQPSIRTKHEDGVIQSVGGDRVVGPHRDATTI